MNVLIIGGSATHPGGVEAFCDRAAEALADRDRAWRIDRIATETAYLRPRGIPTLLRQLRAVIRRRQPRPDVAWVQYVNLPDLLYVAAARAIGIPVVITPHLGANWRSQRSPVLRTISARMMALADRIALLSRTQQLEIALPERTPRAMIRTFLPAFILRAPPPDAPAAGGPLRLLHAARLSEGKGTFLTIELAARLRDAGVAFTLEIAGGADADTFARLHAAIAQHDLAGHVAVLGRVDGAGMLETLGRADALLHLSTIDSYPLILLEAMACGAFPVALDLAGARDMIETYDGQIVGQADPVGESAAWLIAADVDDLRRRARAQAHRVRDDYDWRGCAETLAAMLADCAAARRAPRR